LPWVNDLTIDHSIRSVQATKALRSLCFADGAYLDRSWLDTAQKVTERLVIGETSLKELKLQCRTLVLDHCGHIRLLDCPNLTTIRANCMTLNVQDLSGCTKVYLRNVQLVTSQGLQCMHLLEQIEYYNKITYFGEWTLSNMPKLHTVRFCHQSFNTLKVQHLPSLCYFETDDTSGVQMDTPSLPKLTNITIGMVYLHDSQVGKPASSHKIVGAVCTPIYKRIDNVTETQARQQSLTHEDWPMRPMWPIWP
jgi:hypothetical protein